MTLQVDIPNNCLCRLARIYELKYDLTNLLPVQDITEQDTLEFSLSFIDGMGSLKEKKNKK
jgi:hypothetical protein